MAMLRRRWLGLKGSMTASVFGAACAFALASAVCASARAASATPAPNPFDQPVHPLGVGDVLPDATYVDQAGRRVSIQQLRGRTLVIGFIYTNCADECPILTEKFGRLQAALPADRFELLEISIDPARDTPLAIANFARSRGVRGENWRVLTGDASLVDSFAKPLGVSVVQGDRGQLLHSERTVIAGPDGRIDLLVDDAGWTATQLVAAARHADGLPSNGLARFDLALGKAVQAVCGGSTAAKSGIWDLVGVLGVIVVGGLVALLLARRLFLT
ncbi:MAG TPA: SCO family protein [Candidatus Eremiobacteraceae bacterium]|nr:SCO family protein [Candidatus Eremiobacteraceae bacterium]